MAEATPRPWEYQSAWSQIVSPEGVVADLKQRGMPEEVAIGEYELPEMDANGALIVEAVNSYDAYRALLEAAEELDAAMKDVHGAADYEPDCLICIAAIALRAAIAECRKGDS